MKDLPNNKVSIIIISLFYMFTCLKKIDMISEFGNQSVHFMASREVVCGLEHKQLICLIQIYKGADILLPRR